MKIKKRATRKKNTKPMIIKRGPPPPEILRVRALLEASPIKRAVHDVGSEPDSDEADACFEHFEERIKNIPANGRGVQALLKATILWSKKAAKKGSWQTGKWDAKTKKSKYITVKNPFFTQYVSVLRVASALLFRDVKFDRKSVELLLPYIGQAMTSIQAEGWFHPEKRAEKLLIFSESLVQSCPELVEQQPVFGPILTKGRRAARGK